MDFLYSLAKYPTHSSMINKHSTSSSPRSSTNILWLFTPTQFAIQGQWWSSLSTHLSHTLQWWVLRGFKILQVLQVVLDRLCPFTSTTGLEFSTLRWGTEAGYLGRYPGSDLEDRRIRTRFRTVRVGVNIKVAICRSVGWKDALYSNHANAIWAIVGVSRKSTAIMR